MKTLWILIQVLCNVTTQHSAADIAQITETRLALVDETRSGLFYKNIRPIQLRDGIVVGTLDVREFKNKNKPPIIILDDLQGTCITLDMLKHHVTDLGLPTQPSDPVPNAEIHRNAKLEGKRISLGFKWSRPECLSSVVTYSD